MTYRQFFSSFFRIGVGIAALGVALHAGAQESPNNGLESLALFVKTVQSGSAVFEQVVTTPARDGLSPKVKVSSGSFEFARPNRFRFVYKKPFEQTIVADGDTLWLYDLDLNQVSSRKLAQALASTPAAVITSALDLKDLQAQFNLTNLPDVKGLKWVQAIPMQPDVPLQSIRVGLSVNEKTVVLVALEIVDSFGQKSVMTFSQFQANPKFGFNHFRFAPPAGADVIRQ